MSDTSTSNNAGIILGSILAIILGISLPLHHGELQNAGFWGYSGFLITGLPSGIITGIISALIGDSMRQAACPDAIFTTGGMFDILKAKLFWAIGPQCIGGLIGGGLGAHIACVIMTKLFF